MALAIVEARRKATENRDRYDQLKQRHADLVAKCSDEELRQDVMRAQVHRELLVPFTEAFSRLKNVRLAEFADFEMPGVGAMPVIEVVSRLEMTLRSGWALLGGSGSGAGAGAGAGATAYTAVGAFGAASTGTPIATLSGAAAGNATLAFLGGGSLATGGGGIALGTAVLSGVVAVPAVLVGAGVLTALGRRDLRSQYEAESRLNDGCADFLLERERVDGVLRRAEHVRAVLRFLRDAGFEALHWFTATVEKNEDVTAWSEPERACLSELVNLAVVTTALMRAPLTDVSGAVADVDGGALANAHAWLRRYADDEVARAGDGRPVVDGPTSASSPPSVRWLAG
ncbi:hypothetical protein GCM10023201_33210 [Actinomycetospora corticicola]